jgi:hypothetical protein
MVRCCMGGERWGMDQIWEEGSGRLGRGRSRNLYNLFRIIKQKHIFMKTDMTRDINTLRCNIKTTITKMRGVVTKKHTWRGMKIQFMIVIGTQKRNAETFKST